MMPVYRVVRIDESTLNKLRRVKGQMMSESGEPTSFNQVIRALIESWTKSGGAP